MADETLEPFDWWWSGNLWYCHLQRPGRKPVSGAGVTKPQAVADARKQLLRQRTSFVTRGTANSN